MTWAGRNLGPRHPSIFQIGRVRDDGQVVTVEGWGLGLCAAGCNCHRHPNTGALSIYQDNGRGLLGLRMWRVCDCCEPWTSAELAAVLTDLTNAQDLQPPPPTGRPS